MIMVIFMLCNRNQNYYIYIIYLSISFRIVTSLKMTYIYVCVRAHARVCVWKHVTLLDPQSLLYNIAVFWLIRIIIIITVNTTVRKLALLLHKVATYDVDAED
jgi:hypothetical protein